MSKKPRVFSVLLLLAAFIMVNVSAAVGALPSVNVDWTNLSDTADNTVSSRGTITGKVYNADEHVFATVYASIYGEEQPVFDVAKDVYGDGQAFTLDMSKFTTLKYDTTYTVSLKVYTGDSADNITNSVYSSFESPAFTYVASSGGGGGGGGGSSTSKLPAINATLGQFVTVSYKTGANVNVPDCTVSIPANAMASDFKVKISKVADTSDLSLEEKTKLVSDVFDIVKDKTDDFSKAVTITINFDKSKVDSNYELKICYYDETDEEWVPLDDISVDNGKVSGYVTHFTKFAVIAYPKTDGVFNPKDIAGHWAEADIKQLIELGAINGYPDGSFKPDGNITRAEFATVLAKAFNLAPSSKNAFADTANHWAKASISAAAAAGIVNGYSATTFGPDDKITREQMAVMIAKAAKLAASTSAVTFSDSTQISSWAQDAVASTSEKGIINGYPDKSFKPQNHATRAEAVTIIVKALE